jgi:hypothetical protein
MAKTAQRRPRVRLDIRIPVDLLGWLKMHADMNHKTVTSIIVDNLMELRKKKGGFEVFDGNGSSQKQSAVSR